MKKLILSAICTIGFCVYGFATNKVKIQLDHWQKEGTPAQKKKVKHYDFSLFKFVKPLPKKEEKDSTKTSEELLKGKNQMNETTYHQEKPLTFFIFSYAS
tara:strand:- start:3681 stop:3980 length:300 start_codon:yes stop_codon:yes gene_type:complete